MYTRIKWVFILVKVHTSGNLRMFFFHRKGQKVMFMNHANKMVILKITNLKMTNFLIQNLPFGATSRSAANGTFCQIK